LTARILTEYKQRIQDFKLVPSGGGCFELSLDGNLVFSKLKTGEFPDEAEMIAQVGKQLRSKAQRPS
jgi:selenoprotein W-related protein